MIDISALLTVIAAVGGIACVLCWAAKHIPIGEPGPEPGARNSTRMTPEQLRLRISHDAPYWPLTLSEARRACQQHRGCSLEHCGRKRAGFTALYRAGKLQPDNRIAELLQRTRF
ncbi:hypothetical protein [Nocardia sp. NPDC057455]|uniref:hypothetical protein n=1 Tax=Nocardia sp. NPDC057455 TaxID=3346138 RepID=UPI0036712486